MHVDMEARRSAAFPPDVQERIATLAKAHAALPIPPQVGHKIGIPRKG
jgi:acyl-CoA thioester hydrolase